MILNTFLTSLWPLMTPKLPHNLKLKNYNFLYIKWKLVSQAIKNLIWNKCLAPWWPLVTPNDPLWPQNKNFAKLWLYACQIKDICPSGSLAYLGRSKYDTEGNKKLQEIMMSWDVWETMANRFHLLADFI
jgi:hypothetical protein